MFILFHFKNELIYFLYFLPLCMLKITFNYYMRKKKDRYIYYSESFSNIFLIVLYFYSFFSNKNSREYNIKTKNKKLILLILFSISFYLIKDYLEKFELKNTNLDNILIIFIDLIFIKKQIYSHHILSIIIIICLFILNLIFYHEIPTSLYIFILIQIYCKNFSITLIKYINTIYFINIYLLFSLIGIFSFLFRLIQINFSFSQMNLQYIIYMTICFFENIMFCYIILKINVIYAIICYQISYFLVDCISFDFDNLKIHLFFIFFQTFSSFIYLEIIELNFWKLNKNIKKNIISRGENDTIYTLNHNNSHIDIIENI